MTPTPETPAGSVSRGFAAVMVWHDEGDRLAVWGTLDPPDACMCTGCVLADESGAER